MLGWIVVAAGNFWEFDCVPRRVVGGRVVDVLIFPREISCPPDAASQNFRRVFRVEAGSRKIFRRFL